MALSTIGTNSIADSAVTTAKSTANITMVNQWRITTSFTQSAGESDITSNWELVDTNSYGSIGSNMTESSGIFTFPSTGVYKSFKFDCTTADGSLGAGDILGLTQKIEGFNQAPIKKAVKDKYSKG